MQTEYTQAEMQLYITLHNHYKAETDKRIEDLQQLIDIRDKRIDDLIKEIDDLREVINEKDDRIDHLTDVILGKDKTKCKVVSLRPAYATEY